jgi:voltage-gated potassium channel
MRKFRIRDALIAVAGFIVLGTLIFHVLEGWSFLDSLYVTAQTVTTVGFGDLAPVTTAGRIFASLFMVVGVGVVLFALTSAVQSIVQSEVLAAVGQRRRVKKIKMHKEHYIICGAGRVGSHLIRDLQRTGESFIVLEREPNQVAEMISKGVNVLVRDATLEESLREAGVEHARGLAACLPDDADNVYVALIARDLNPNLHIVARAAEEQAEMKLLRAGANRVVAPTIIGGHRMAVALTKPAVDDFIDSISASKLDLAFEQVEVSSSSSLVDRELRESEIRPKLNIVIVAIRRAGGEMFFNPSGNKQIKAGDMLIAIGHPDSLVQLKQIAAGEKRPHAQRN